MIKMQITMLQTLRGTLSSMFIHLWSQTGMALACQRNLMELRISSVGLWFLQMVALKLLRNSSPGVQTEAGRPKGGATWDASSRRPTPKPTGYDGYTDGYDEHNGFNNDLTNPRGDAHRNDSYYDDYYRKQGSNMEPTMNTGGGRARPSQSSLAASPNASLSGATNDIRAAVGLLREVAKPRVSTSPRTLYTEPTYTNTIDSKEASRRYGNFNFSSRPQARDDGYTSTIDSREALRKYSGRAV
ncbi:hypothetical protein OIU84_017924 [Salix udensis]|uniref:Uncharacterized protein n=1 Tax=Salix udensis TaxID=889485 RepID=A0AAD6L2Z3_9ROSI|nr:hypothetical protein OIU84_017924 [Salix udensis]